ncbi:MAG: ABA4-like family protein [Paracoccaceae bacterium]|nr:ABA4-like family protein [Paracoccaceae bacterium]
MDFELIFSLAGMTAFVGWGFLVISPWAPLWSDRIAGILLPSLLALGYAVLLLFFPAESGGFGSFAEVQMLFNSASALMAGWIHFLAFDLVVGAWICRAARRQGIPFWLVLPCLPLTFLFGPAGFLAFMLVRGLRSNLAVASH